MWAGLVGWMVMAFLEDLDVVPKMFVSTSLPNGVAV
jgi:hypothetical protein